MITGKQRSYLKGLANQLDPLVFIGKADLTDTVIKEIDNVLNYRNKRDRQRSQCQGAGEGEDTGKLSPRPEGDGK